MSPTARRTRSPSSISSRKNRGESKLLGLIPVGWYPGALAFDRRRRHDRRRQHQRAARRSRKQADDADAKGFNSHQYFGSLSIVPIPADNELPRLSEIVAANMRRAENRRGPAAAAQEPAAAAGARAHRRAQRDQARRLHHQGESHLRSGVRRHRGGQRRRRRSASSANTSRPTITSSPASSCCSTTRIAAGILSADGHQWSTTAFSTDYMEKSFAGFAAQLSGRLRDRRERRAGLLARRLHLGQRAEAQEVDSQLRRVHVAGDPHVRWRDPARKGTPTPRECYLAWKNKTNEIVFDYYPSVETIRPFSPHGLPGLGDGGARSVSRRLRS